MSYPGAIPARSVTAGPWYPVDPYGSLHDAAAAQDTHQSVPIWQTNPRAGHQSPLTTEPFLATQSVGNRQSSFRSPPQLNTTYQAPGFVDDAHTADPIQPVTPRVSANSVSLSGPALENIYTATETNAVIHHWLNSVTAALPAEGTILYDTAAQQVANGDTVRFAEHNLGELHHELGSGNLWCPRGRYEISFAIQPHQAHRLALIDRTTERVLTIPGREQEQLLLASDTIIALQNQGLELTLPVSDSEIPNAWLSVARLAD
jgi:hypothetical protein